MKQTLLSALVVVLLISTFAYADGQSTFKSASEKVQKSMKQGISYSLVVNGKGDKNVEKSLVYNKNQKIRVDTAKDISTIIDGDKMYVYNVANKSAMVFSVKQQQGKSSMDLYDASDIPNKAVFVKKTTKNGYACQLVTSEEDGIKMEYYLTDEYGYPTCIKESNGNEVNMTNFKLGVSDDKFKLPSDVKITEVDRSKTGSMLGNMLKETADDTVLSGVKEGSDEVVSEQKSKVKEETKESTKKAVNKFFGF